MSGESSQSSPEPLQDPLFDLPKPPDSPPESRPPIKWAPPRKCMLDDPDDLDDTDDPDRLSDMGVATTFGAMAMRTGVFPKRSNVNVQGSAFPARPPHTSGETLATDKHNDPQDHGDSLSPRGVDSGRNRAVLPLRNKELAEITDEGEYHRKIQEYLNKDAARIKRLREKKGVVVSGIDPSEYIRFGEPVPDYPDVE